MDPTVEETLKLLGLSRVNHATLLTSSPSFLGMLHKVKDYVTWGEVDAGTILTMLRERGELIGGKPVTDPYSRAVGYGSLRDLAEAIHDCKADMRNLSQIKPVVRLHSPKGGLRRSKKRPYKSFGELGYRGEAINQLILRMV